mgnify:CR=1 FL=1
MEYVFGKNTVDSYYFAVNQFFQQYDEVNKKNLKEYPDKERELWRTFDSTPYELRIAMGNLDEDEMVPVNMYGL